VRYAHVLPYINVDSMFFITHITRILTLATMYNLVCLHVRLLSECFITHITGMRTLATMYNLVSLQDTL